MGDSSDDESNSDISINQNARSAESRQRKNSSKSFAYKNIAQKIFNRQISGSFSEKTGSRCEKIFEKIPPRLRFWLKDMVPESFCRNHVLMGFSQCGQFMLSFSCREKSTLRRTFREGFSFKLHFYSWVPGRQVRLVHSVPLFDDDSVDNRVAVSVAQWKHNPSVLVAYGIAEVATERSYLSVVGVPKLGCRKCVALSNSTCDEELSYGGKRCVEHNFALHTKFYSAAESTLCEPVVQLAYEKQIIIYTDFLHLLEIDFVTSEQNENQPTDSRVHEEQFPQAESVVITSSASLVDDASNIQNSRQAAETVVQRILADFSDLEMETCSMSRPVQLSDMMGQELCIQANSTVFQSYVDDYSENGVPSPRTLISPPLRSPRRRPTEGISQLNDLHRKIAEKTYEFVEEPELNCVKLSSYRKKRLADKKYEFSEDNSENIVPFRVSNRKYYIETSNRNQSKRPKSPTVENVVLRVQNQISTTSPPAAGDSKGDSICLLDRDPVHDVEYRVTQMQEDGSLKTVALHDNTSRTLSDGKVHPMDPYLVHSGNSKCSKHFIRHFVESDDDITSIITDSEDDCMYGFHVALPLTAHGAGYAPLQAVGLGAWERLRNAGNVPANGPLKGITIPLPALRARQRSLDTEMLCNEVCVRLCLLNKKKFIYCFDWGCHVIDVCQSSGCLCGLCAMWFWASEEEVNSSEVECQSCQCKESNAGCLAHRRQYAAECLFIWNLVTGDYHTEHESFKEDPTQDANRASGSERARQLAISMAPMFNPFGNENRLLVHSIGRSLKRLTDLDHCIQITRKYPDASDSDSTNEEAELYSDMMSMMSVENEDELEDDDEDQR